MDAFRKRKSRSKSGIAGSKPAALKISKDFHSCTKIKPLIIYLRSPETIHTEAKDFKAVVQRLTGSSSSSSSNSCTLPIREDFTALRTSPNSNPKPSLYHLPEKEEESYQITPAPPVWPNDYFPQVISPPLPNSLVAEDLDLDLDMLCYPEMQLFSSPSFQQLDLPFNYLCDVENPHFLGVCL